MSERVEKAIAELQRAWEAEFEARGTKVRNFAVIVTGTEGSEGGFVEADCGCPACVMPMVELLLRGFGGEVDVEAVKVVGGARAVH